MRVTILGCGEAFDDRLPNTSLLVEFAGTTLLLDCGYSAPPQVWHAATDPDAIDAVYISHAHADHYLGLPALLGRFWEDGRTKPLAILSRRAVLEQIPQLMEFGYRGLAARFKYPIRHCAVEPGRPLEFGGATLDFAESAHAVPNLAVRIESGGAVICYSGDGMFTDASRDLFSRAAFVVHEAYSFEKIPVHADIPALVELAEQQNIGRLAFVHVQRNLRRAPDRIHEVIRRSAGRLLMPEAGDRCEI